MNKKELVKAYAEEMGMTQKDAEKNLEGFITVVSNALVKGDKVKIPAFGTFEVTERAAREGRNPQTGETIAIPASKSPKFKPAKALKDMVNA